MSVYIELTRSKSSKIEEKEKPSASTENRVACQFFKNHILSYGKKQSCRYGLGCRNTHNFRDYLPDLKAMYKEWQKMSAPPAKKIKLDEAAATQEPLVSNLIAKLSDEPFDKEYATFLNDKSPVLKIMTKRGWTKSVGLGKKGRKGN